MTATESITHLARAIRHFPSLGPIDEAGLLAVVRAELGDERILDDFRPYPGGLAKAIGPRRMLHVISGNTPHAGLQSVIRGLLLGAHNLCKIPSAGLPEIAAFRGHLPPELAERIEISETLPPGWLESADAIVVFGDDLTIDQFRRQIRPRQRFAGHGYRISFGIIFDDPRCESAAAAARDASLFDQQGCLSPHVFYIREPAGCAGVAREYAAALAVEMERFNQTERRSPLGPAESSSIARLRGDYRFAAANGDSTAIWESTGSTDWTVVFEAEPHFTVSCLNRVVFVKPLPANLHAATASVRKHFSAVGIWPWTEARAREATNTGASRVCQIGEMQLPGIAWHQDGAQTLAPFVEWIDLETPRTGAVPQS